MMGGKPRREEEEEETVAFHRLTHWFTYYIRRSSIAPYQGMSKAIPENTLALYRLTYEGGSVQD